MQIYPKTVFSLFIKSDFGFPYFLFLLTTFETSKLNNSKHIPGAFDAEQCVVHMCSVTLRQEIKSEHRKLKLSSFNCCLHLQLSYLYLWRIFLKCISSMTALIMHYIVISVFPLLVRAKGAVGTKIFVRAIVVPKTEINWIQKEEKYNIVIHVHTFIMSVKVIQRNVSSSHLYIFSSNSQRNKINFFV